MIDYSDAHAHNWIPVNFRDYDVCTVCECLRLKTDMEKQMSGRDKDPYLDTIERLEPDIAVIDAGAFYASVGISLKRIADAMEYRNKRITSHSFSYVGDKKEVCRHCGEAKSLHEFWGVK